MTPLVDVVLVLLIVFMVVTPMLQRGRPVQLPRAHHVSELGGGREPVVLSVVADGRTFLDQREIRTGDLSRAVRVELGARPGASVVLKADRSLPYRAVREVVLELSKAGVGGISLAAAPSRPGEPE